MNSLSKAIQQAVEECLRNGNGCSEANEDVTIESTWVSWHEDTSYDVVAVYIYDNEVLRFSYQLDETHIKA